MRFLESLESRRLLTTTSVDPQPGPLSSDAEVIGVFDSSEEIGVEPTVAQYENATLSSPRVTYNASTGDVVVDSPIPLDSFSLVSEMGIFSAAAAINLGGFPSTQTDHRVSLYNGGGLESVSLGSIAVRSLSSDALESDLSIHATAFDGTVFDEVRLVRVENADVVLSYDSITGELDASSVRPMTGLELKSASGVFSATRPVILTDGFDIYRPDKLFKFVREPSSHLDFGPAVQPGLEIEFLRSDLDISSSSLTLPYNFDSFHVAQVLRPAVLLDSPPVADAGGPYLINEGDGLSLDASSSFDLEQTPLDYSWDLNGDGVFGDAVGGTPAVSWEELRSLHEGSIAESISLSVRVDDGTATSIATTDLTIEAPDPTIEIALRSARVTYNALTGDVFVNSPVALGSFSLVSTSGIFSGAAAANLGEFPSLQTDHRVSKYDVGGFQSINLGPIAERGLTSEALQGDLAIHATAVDGTLVDAVRLIRVEDADVVLSYDPVTGELDALSARPMTGLELQSASGVFSATRPSILTDGFDVYRPDKLFKFVRDPSSYLDFGPAVQTGLDIEILRGDLDISGSSLTLPYNLDTFHVAQILRPAVLLDSPPVAHAGGPYVINEGNGFSLDASSSFDLEQSPLDYSWDLNGDGVFGDAVGGTPSVSWEDFRLLHGGTIADTVSLSVRVDDGTATSVATATLTIENVDPSIESIDFTASPTPGELVSFDVVATDPGGDALSYVWSFGDGTGQVATEQGTVTHAFDRAGAFTVTVTAADGDGGQDTATAVITIAEAPAPVAVGDNLQITETGSLVLSEVLLANDMTNALDSVEINEISEPEHGEIAIADGQFTYAPSQATVELLFEGDSLTETLTYSIRDAFGISNSAVAVITIAGEGTPVVNEPPVVPDGFAFTLSEREPELLWTTSDFEASDPEGGPLTYEWDMDSDGVFETADSGTGAPAERPFTGNSDHAPKSIQVRVTDDEGNVTEAMGTATLVNEVPCLSIEQVDVFASTVRLGYAGGDVDALTVVVNWGDESTETFGVDAGDLCGEDGGVTDFWSHDYTTPGSYSIVVVVDDLQGGSYSETYEITAVAPLPGDVNRDGIVNAMDIDSLYAALGRGETDSVFDLDESGAVDQDDVDFLLEGILGTTYGDANLDGVFDSSDLIQLFAAGQYEDGVESNSGWASGDFNGDKEFSTADLVRALQTGTYQE